MTSESNSANPPASDQTIDAIANAKVERKVNKMNSKREATDNEIMERLVSVEQTLQIESAKRQQAELELLTLKSQLAEHPKEDVPSNNSGNEIIELLDEGSTPQKKVNFETSPPRKKNPPSASTLHPNQLKQIRTEPSQSRKETPTSAHRSHRCRSRYLDRQSGQASAAIAQALRSCQQKEKAQEEASRRHSDSLIRAEVKKAFGFVPDPSLSPFHNAVRLRAKCSTSNLSNVSTMPTNMAFHDLTPNKSAPKNAKSLLGLGPKFICTPKFTKI